MGRDSLFVSFREQIDTKVLALCGQGQWFRISKGSVASNLRFMILTDVTRCWELHSVCHFGWTVGKTVVTLRKHLIVKHQSG